VKIGREKMKIIDGLISAARVVVMVATVLVMVLIVADVFLRWLFNSPILGVVEYSQLLMVVLLLATSTAAQEDSHIKIDILYKKFPPKVQAVCDIVTLTLSFCAAMLIATQAFSQGMTASRLGMRFVTIGIARSPFFFLYSAGLLLLCVSIVVLIIEAVRKLKKNDGCGKELENNE